MVNWLVHLSCNLYTGDGSKYAKFWLEFSILVAFETFWFQNRNPDCFGSADDTICIFRILVPFGLLNSENWAVEDLTLHPTPRPLKRAGKIVHSSITQPRFVRFCWNLVGWCILWAGLVVRTENDRVASSCNALHLPPFLVVLVNYLLISR